MASSSEAATSFRKCTRTSPCRPFSAPRDSSDSSHTLFLTIPTRMLNSQKYQSCSSFLLHIVVVILCIFLVLLCDMLSQPLIGTSEEVILHRGDYLYDGDYQKLSNAVPAFLQVPKQIVRDEEGGGDNEAEMASEVEMVLHLRRNHPVFVLPPLVQQLNLVLFEDPVINSMLQLSLPRLLVIQQLIDEEKLVKGAYRDACINEQQRISNRYYPEEDNRNQIVENDEQQTQNEVFSAFFSPEDETQEDEIQHQRPYDLQKQHQLRDTNRKNSGRADVDNYAHQ